MTRARPKSRPDIPQRKSVSSLLRSRGKKSNHSTLADEQEYWAKRTARIMASKDEEERWCNRVNEIIMAKHEPNRFFNHWFWKQSFGDFVRVGSTLFVIEGSIMMLIVKILWLLGVR